MSARPTFFTNKETEVLGVKPFKFTKTFAVLIFLKSRSPKINCWQKKVGQTLKVLVCTNTNLHKFEFVGYLLYLFPFRN